MCFVSEFFLVVKFRVEEMVFLEDSIRIVLVMGVGGRMGVIVFDKLKKIEKFVVCGLVWMEEVKVKLGGKGVFIGDVIKVDILSVVFEGIDVLIIIMSVVLKMKFGFDFFKGVFLEFYFEENGYFE